MSREGKPKLGTSEWEDATRPTVVGMPVEWERIARGEPGQPSDASTLEGIDKLSAVVARELSPATARDYSPATARDHLPATARDLSPSEQPAVPAHSESPAGPTEPEAESLQSHLDRFLERMTGKARVAEPQSPTLVDERPAAVTQVIERAPREPSCAPERRDQMAALRELANQTARDAVVLHLCRMLVSRSRKILFAALGATLVSNGLAAVAIACQFPGAKQGALLTAGLAVVLSCWFFGSCRTLRRQVALLDPQN
jgi:hypothetical protein